MSRDPRQGGHWQLVRTKPADIGRLVDHTGSFRFSIGMKRDKRSVGETFMTNLIAALALAAVVGSPSVARSSRSEQSLGTLPGPVIEVTGSVDARFVGARATDVLRFLARTADIELRLSPALEQRPPRYITINARAATIVSVFDQVCREAGLRYTVVDARTILVSAD